MRLRGRGRSHGHTASEPVRLRPVARPGAVVSALALIVFVAAGAFFAGSELRPPEAPTSGEERPLITTARVELRSVYEGIQVVGRVVPPKEVAVHLGSEAARPGVDRNVVTRSVVSPGQEVRAGDLLAEISGRPVLAVPPDTPLYRDLKIGSVGEDVRALQRMLRGLGYAVDGEGRLGAVTMTAIEQWYRGAGYQLAKRRQLAWSELVPLPAQQVTIVRATRVGRVVGGGTPIALGLRGKPHIDLRVDAGQIDAFRSVRSVYVTHEGKEYRAGIRSIGTLATDEESGRSSYPIRVRLPSKLSEDPTLTSLPVSTVRPAEPSLAVPVVALREDARGRYVLVLASPEGSEGQGSPESAPKEQTRRVPVEVIAVAGGWVAVAEDPLLEEGTQLRVG